MTPELITATYQNLVHPTLASIFQNIEKDSEAAFKEVNPILFTQC